MNAFREFWRRNQAVLLHAPLFVILSIGAYIFLRALDPRIGVEGFGDLFGYLLDGLRAMIVVSLAFWFKRTALFDIHRTTELELFEASRCGSPQAERVLIRDRLEWAALLAFFGWMLTQ